MTKVVLVWNEHPSEVVAGHQCREVAKILREKYKHKVLMKKIDPKETNYGIVRELHGTKRLGRRAFEAVEKLEAMPTSGELARDLAKQHKAFTFNFHNAPACSMGGAWYLPPEEYAIEEKQGFAHSLKIKGEVLLTGEGKAFVVEVPAWHDQELRPSQAIAKRKGYERAKRIAGDLGRERAKKKLWPDYHFKVAPITNPLQKDYISKAISEKIAEAIHNKIKK